MPRSPRLMGLVGLICSSALFLPACSSTPAPSIGQASVVVADRTDVGLVLRFTLPCENAGDEGLPLREARYSVALDGRTIFTGVRSPEATIRRFGSQDIVLPAVLPLAPGQPRPTGLAQYQISGDITYLRPGILSRALFDAELIQPSVDFNSTGTIDLGQ